MIRSNSKVELRKMCSVLVFILLAITLCSSFTFALGYAPLTIYGHISLEGKPIIAEVSMQILENQTISYSESTFSNENGDFIFVLTLKENSLVDVQISTKTTEIYVDIIEDALPWNTYFLDMHLEEDAFAKVKVSSSTRDTSKEFDVDMQRIISGEILDNPDIIEEFKEKYDMEVVSLDEELNANEENSNEEREIPVLEEAKFISPPESDKTTFFNRGFLEIIAVILVIACIFLIRHEAKH